LEPKLFLVFEQDEALMVRMGGYFNNHQLQQNTLESLEILSAKGLKKLLLDITKLEVLMNISQVWIRDTWYPKATEAGLTHFAIVTPLGFITPDDIEKMNSNYEHNKVKSVFFESEKKAAEWLSNQ
jgi:hypothetical protein